MKNYRLLTVIWTIIFVAFFLTLHTQNEGVLADGTPIGVKSTNNNTAFIGQQANVGMFLENTVGGIIIDNTQSKGIELKNIGNHGLHILDAGVNAIQIDNSTFDGVHVLAAGRDGVRVNNTAGAGFCTFQAMSHGVQVEDAGGHGIHVISAAMDAGYFDGDVTVTGTLSKGGGSFKIDHPVDPKNKFLSHSFVESPDMMNVYNGNVQLDKKGQAVIMMPDYFEALNKDFRYQLTCIGGFSKVFVSEKISQNHFKISGGKPGMEVSWQVTGVRDDPWARANRIPIEEAKKEANRGTYLHPEAYASEGEHLVNH